MPPFNMPPPNFNGPMGPYGGYNGPAPGGFRGPRPFHNSGKLPSSQSTEMFASLKKLCVAFTCKGE